MNHKSNPLPLQRAIACLGGVANLARAIGVRQSAISNWLKRGTVIRAEYCSAIERATAGQVTRRDLRPDDWHLIWPELVEKLGLEAAHEEREVV